MELSDRLIGPWMKWLQISKQLFQAHSLERNLLCFDLNVIESFPKFPIDAKSSLVQVMSWHHF